MPKKLFPTRVIFICSVLLVIACAITLYSNNHTLHRYNYLHFGTTIQVTTGIGEPQLSNQTISDIDRLLENLHYKWHPWREGELFDLNKNLGQLTSFQTSAEIINMIKLSQKFYNISQGYFNPAIGKLVAYWGFHSDNPGTTKTNSDNLDLNSYVQHLPNPNHILINTNNLTIQNTNRNLQLDFSGFIKADAMLQIKKILLAQHIHNALINIGGDIYVMGFKDAKHSTPWVIAVKSNEKTIALKVYDQESIATSGISARFIVDKKDKKFRHHIMNPKTGHSATGFDSVTVIHSDPYLCDAAATALLVAGMKDYQSIAQSMGVDKYILVTRLHQTIISKPMHLKISENR